MRPEEDFFFFLRTAAILQGGANLVPYPRFTQPFETGAWRVGQGAAGWVYDSINKLAINDGVYNDTQFLYLDFPPAASSAARYLLQIEVVSYPYGGGNTGTVTIYCLGYSLLLTSTPGLQKWELPANSPPGGIYFLVNGQARLGIREVIIRPL